MAISTDSQIILQKDSDPGKIRSRKTGTLLFWAKGCHWSNRASITRELLGLQDAIKVEIVGWDDDAYEKPLGWEFINSPDHINPETGAQFLSELYYNADPEYTGRATVPSFCGLQREKGSEQRLSQADQLSGG